MKKIIITMVIGLLTQQLTQAQGTVYFSSLNLTLTGSHPIGSDSWLAAGFGTGNNVGGFVLNSVQLGMIDASGSPNGFTVMIYSQSPFGGAILPGNSLGALDGSANPSTAGIYTYTPTANIFLSANTGYFVVLTAGTTVANGAYSWSESAFPPSSSGGWGAAINGVLGSSNGTSGWSYTPYLGIAQFSITATAIPEPSSAFLLLLGSGVFVYVRRAFQREF